MIKQTKVHKVPGIYKILNRVTGDFYIGSSMNCYKRMYQHQTLLRNNKHHSPHLQHSWNKYGHLEFEYIVLEYVDVENLLELRQVEQKYLDELLPVYNVSRDAISSLSTKFVPRKKSHIDKVLPQNKSNWSEIRAKISSTVKNLWSDSSFREHQLSCMNSELAKTNYSNSMKARYKDPNYKDRVNHSVLRSFGSGKNKSSKFSRDDILTIRDLAHRGTSLDELSSIYKSSMKTIKRIVNRETWNFIT